MLESELKPLCQKYCVEVLSPDGEISQAYPGPDYPMYTVCTCTWGLIILEAPSPGKRENCRGNVCHWGMAKVF